MLSIGEFAIISSITKKTLRYYDEIGLLKPETVQKGNHYRQYSKNQLDRAKKICEYRSIGMPLKIIKQLLDSDENDFKQKHISQRIQAIEQEISMLTKQKSTASLILKKKDGYKDISDKMVVSETVFEESKWFVMEVEAEIYEMDSCFSSFYEEARKKGLFLKSGHMIKVSEDSRSIVARVEDSSKENVVKMPAQKSITLEDIDLNARDLGYLKLVEYGKNRNYVFDYFLESYEMYHGMLRLSIQAIYR